MGLERLELSTEALQGLRVVRVRGEVDLASAPALRDHLRGTVIEGSSPHVVVDLSNVAFLDSAGLSALIEGGRAAEEHGGELVLAAPPQQVAKVLNVTGLETYFSVYTTIAEALEHESASGEGPSST